MSYKKLFVKKQEVKPETVSFKEIFEGELFVFSDKLYVRVCKAPLVIVDREITENKKIMIRDFVIDSSAKIEKANVFCLTSYTYGSFKTDTRVHMATSDGISYKVI